MRKFLQTFREIFGGFISHNKPVGYVMGPSHNFRNANEHVNDVKTVGDIMINRTSKNIQNRKTRSDNISGIREF